MKGVAEGVSPNPKAGAATEHDWLPQMDGKAELCTPQCQLLFSPICDEGDEGKGIEFLQVSIKDKVQTIFSPPQGTFVSHHNWEVLSCKGNENLVLTP